jgi:hypothetical protein
MLPSHLPQFCRVLNFRSEVYPMLTYWYGCKRMEEKVPRLLSTPLFLQKFLILP